MVDNRALEFAVNARGSKKLTAGLPPERQRGSLIGFHAMAASAWVVGASRGAKRR